MKKLLLLGALLVLVACKPTEEEKTKLKEALPPGCTATDIGSYGSLDTLVIIDCDNRGVSSAYMEQRKQQGKATVVREAATFVIR